MSYSFRNRPKLSDKYRGKSGDEILNDLKKQIDEDRKMFFESSPSWNSVQSPGSFSRAENPLDDMMSRGRQDIRSHLDDLAQRHPEFADHLRCPPWGGEMGAHGTWGRKRRGSGSSGEERESPSPGPSGHQPSPDEASPSRGRTRQSNLPQHGLRNTVDIGQQQQNLHHADGDSEKRGQRSWSAPPPDSRAQSDPPRYVSRLDIPINTSSSSSSADQGKPPMAPKCNPQPSAPQPQQPQPQPQQSSKPCQSGGNVRHIPIFVEGRDEPLLPKDVRTSESERVFTERAAPQSTFNYGRPSQFTARQPQAAQQQVPPPTHTTSFAQSAAPPKARPFQQPPPPQPQPPPPPPQQPQKQVPPQQEPKEQTPPQAPKPPLPNDPISQVQVVQKDVDELKLKVESFYGTSRTDKDYIYLDEMLTRNLLKLDIIETEGKENVRLARKEVIRNIQKCISILESKVPIPEDRSNMNEGVSDETGDADVETSVVCAGEGIGSKEGVQKMETDPALVVERSNSKSTCTEGQEKMDTEGTANPAGDAQSGSTEATTTEALSASDAQIKAAGAKTKTEGESYSASQQISEPSNTHLDENVQPDQMEVEGSNSEALTVPENSSESGAKKDDKKGNGTPKKSGKSPKSPRKGKKGT